MVQLMLYIKPELNQTFKCFNCGHKTVRVGRSQYTLSIGGNELTVEDLSDVWDDEWDELDQSEWLAECAFCGWCD